MKNNLKYTDLLYFGYDWEDDSEENKKNETDFITEIKAKFPNVKLNDVYDSIKGYRQEVYLEPENEDNYYAWLIAFGWWEFSFTLRLMATNPNNLNKYFELAKVLYPPNVTKSDDEADL